MKSDYKISAIIAAAGDSSRMKSKEFTSKLFIPLRGKPLLFYSLGKLCRVKNIVEIIVVTNDIDLTRDLIKDVKYQIPVKLVLGGLRRQDSVYNGFCEVSSNVDLVLVHDVARPLFETKDVEECIRKASKSGACILASPVVDTLKKVKSHQDELFVESTLSREKLYEVQTPQVFAYSILNDAYVEFFKSGSCPNTFTDESSMVELLGKKVSLVQSSRKNLKITYPEDLQVADVLLHSKVKETSQLKDKILISNEANSKSK